MRAHRLSAFLWLCLAASFPAFAEPVLIANVTVVSPEREPGKLANLLLLRADPLASVEAWDAIETVILRGEIIPRESLAVPSGSATPR